MGVVPGSAHLAAAFCVPGRARPRRPVAGLGSPLLGKTRPPEAAGCCPELTCRSNRATSACQSSAPSAARRSAGSGGPAGRAPPPPPRLPNRERPTPGVGAWSDERCGPRAGPEGLGPDRAGPGRVGAGALISLLSAGSILDLSAGARRLDRGAGATMPVTGRTFRRRRADSESEEDEQDSEEVRCVWGGLPRGRKREAA